MENTMTRRAASSMAASLYTQGKTNRQIAFALMRNGYASCRTGRRLKPHSVYQMLQRSGAVARKQVEVKQTRRDRGATITQRGNKIIIELIVSAR